MQIIKTFTQCIGHTYAEYLLTATARNRSIEWNGTISPKASPKQLLKKRTGGRSWRQNERENRREMQDHDAIDDVDSRRRPRLTRYTSHFQNKNHTHHT